MKLEKRGSFLGKVMLVCRVKLELFIIIGIRAIEDKRNHLIQRRQSFLSLQIISQIIFLPLFKPFLPSIIKLPQKMGPNLMIHNSLNGKLGIPYRQPHNNSTQRLHIIMHNTSIRYSILGKLIIQKFHYFQFLYIFFYIFCSFFFCQWLTLFYQSSKIYICSFVQDLQCKTQIFTMWIVVFYILFILLIHDV